MIKTILFDLDGTLLPMDMDVFVSSYFKLLAKKVAPLGYEPEKLVKSIWAGTAAMVANDGSMTNERAFWKKFCAIYGEEAINDYPVFEEFYRVDFQQAQKFCGFNPKSDEIVKWLKENGYRVLLATNPLFPAVATMSRIRWAGLNAEDFGYISTYENCCHCKPNPDYYRDVINECGLDPAECLMVGNDVNEDMVAASSVGMSVFLITDCIINKDNADISVYPHGSFDDLRKYIAALEK